MAIISSARFFAACARSASISSFHSHVVARRRQVPFITESIPPMQAAVRLVPSSMTTLASPIPRAVQKLQCLARMARSPPTLLQTTRSTSPSKRRPSGVPIRKGKVLIRHLLYCFLAFSNTSSIVPANRKQLSGMSSHSPSRIILNPLKVSFSGTYLPGIPVNCSATEKL